jgi:putative metallohydrolase (TIGR04338 family)
MQRYVDKIVESRWFRGRWPQIVRIEARDGRSRRRGVGQYCGFGLGVIKMPVWTRYEYYILHEVAHVIQGYQYPRSIMHGPEFCSIYLALVSRWMASGTGGILRGAFRRYHVKWRLNGKAAKS